jgi:hypothetical protein
MLQNPIAQTIQIVEVHFVSLLLFNNNNAYFKSLSYTNVLFKLEMNEIF